MAVNEGVKYWVKRSPTRQQYFRGYENGKSAVRVLTNQPFIDPMSRRWLMNTRVVHNDSGGGGGRRRSTQRARMAAAHSGGSSSWAVVTCSCLGFLAPPLTSFTRLWRLPCRDCSIAAVTTFPCSTPTGPSPIERWVLAWTLDLVLVPHRNVHLLHHLEERVA